MNNNTTSKEASSQYTAVSSYYGPGSLGGWYLLILSVIVTWRYSSKTGFRAHSITITTDFIAVMLYPLLSACHLTYLLFACSPSQDDLEYVWDWSPPLHRNLTTTEEEIESNIGEGAESIALALRVLEIFTIFVIYGLVSTLYHELDADRTSPTTFTLLSGFLWSTCVWIILVYKSWQQGALFHVMLRFFMMGCNIMILDSLPSSLLIATQLLMWALHQIELAYKHLYGWFIKAYRQPSVLLRQYFRGIIQFLYNDGAESLIMLPIAWLLTLLPLFGMSVWADSETNLITIVLGFLLPSTGIDVSELDQMAAIIGGALTLLFSIYDVAKDMNVVGSTFEWWSLRWKPWLVAWVLK